MKKNSINIQFKGATNMPRIINIIFILVLLSFVTVSLSKEKSSTMKDALPGQDIVDGFSIGTPEDTETPEAAPAEPATEEPAATEAPETEKSEREDIAGKGVPSIDFLNKLKVAGDVYYNKEFGRYFASPRDMIYIEAEENDNDKNVQTELRRLEVKVDNDEFKQYDGNKSGMLQMLEEGNHFVTVRAVDNVGNRSNNKIEEVIIDNTPPAVYVWYEIPDVSKQYCILEGDVYIPLVANKIVHIPRCHIIKAKAFDWGAGVMPSGLYYAIDSETQYKPYPKDGIKLYDEIQSNLLGMHILRFKSVDNVYNESKPLVVNFYLDDVTPSFMLVPKYGKPILFIGKILNEGCGPFPLPKPEAVPLPPPPPGPPELPKGTTPPPPPPLGQEQQEWGDQVNTSFHYWKKFFNYTHQNGAQYLPGASLTELEFFRNDQSYSYDDFYGDEKEGGKAGKKIDANTLGYDPSVDNEWYIYAYDESGISEISIRKDSTKWDLYKVGQPINFYTQDKHRLDVRVYDCVGNVIYGKQDIFVKILPPESKLSKEPSEPVNRGPVEGTGDTGPSNNDIEKDNKGILESEKE